MPVGSGGGVNSVGVMGGKNREVYLILLAQNSSALALLREILLTDLFVMYLIYLCFTSVSIEWKEIL